MTSQSFRALADVADEIREIVSKSNIKNKPVTISDVVSRINRAVEAFVEDHNERRLYDKCEVSAPDLPPLTNIERNVADMFIAVLETAKDFGVDIAYAVETKCKYDELKIKDRE